MATALQRLQFIIGMTNNVSGPLNDITNSVNKATNHIQDGFGKVALGAGLITGAVMSFQDLTAPAERLNKSLREVSTMGVGDVGLNALSKAAINFTAEFGGADDSIQAFVASAYDLKSGISSLTDNELADFTRISAMLALGTKSDTATITKYVGTMAGVFKTEMESMGKTKWLETLSGQTAAAVQLFKTTGSGISQAFTSLGAAGSALKIGMSEQFAVIGSLSATMEGGMAGTKYKAFLKGVSKAQKEMGLSFADSKGKLLPINEILSKIQGKYGKLSEVAQAGIFQKAFGSDEAVGFIQLLSKDIDGLKNSIADIGKNTGMEKVIEMAQKMADPAPWIAFKTAASSVFFKIVDPLINDNLDALFNNLIRYIDLFPNLTRLIADSVFGFIAFGAVTGAFMVVSGLFSIAIGVISSAFTVLSVLLIPLAPLFGAINVAWRLMLMEFYAGGGILATLRVGFMSLAGSLWATITAMWSWTAALLANPVTWIVIAVLALAAALAFAAYNWDEVKSSFSAGLDASFLSSISTGIVDGIFWIQNFIAGVDLWGGLVAGAGVIGAAMAGAYATVVGWLNSLKAWLSTLNLWASISAGLAGVLGGIQSAFAGLLANIRGMFAGFNPLAGISAGISSLMGQARAAVSGIAVPGTGKNATTGGVSNVLNKSNSSNKTTTINVNNNHRQPLNPAHITHALNMAAS